MASKRPVWVRGKALETVLALGELQPGDLVKIKLNATAFGVASWKVCSVDDDATFPVNLVGLRQKLPDDPHDWKDCVGFRDIIAWRRPVRRKGS